ncbi:hypothetical protein DSCW_11230 [Desulfosarcina widdelii]|uniref:Uncharacterized protein n=1 Tax=Desulfosarcina widdelii TaxID=947919 RepID=A0A5K7YWJ2_9BACT|nr:hypothetical protein DSCW_11230 [Desulfosarcina widdelii]
MAEGFALELAFSMPIGEARVPSIPDRKQPIDYKYFYYTSILRKRITGGGRPRKIGRTITGASIYCPDRTQ